MPEAFVSFTECKAKAVDAGTFHTLVIDGNDEVWAFGRGAEGQLGDGFNKESGIPIRVSSVTGLPTADQVSAGNHHSLARSGGFVWAWGRNDAGQLGDGTTSDRNRPVQVPGISGVLAVAAGGSHSLALLSGGTVVAWGSNSSGQLGDGTTTSSLTPVAVSGLSGVTAISAGYSFSLALTSANGVWAWGMGSNGQLGNGSFASSSIPVQVSGISATAAVAISAGGNHAMAIVAGSPKRLLAWGRNAEGQLGDGTTTISNVPVAVLLPAEPASASAGGAHSLATTTTGEVYAWGSNQYGELADGTTTNSSTPILVSMLNTTPIVAAGNGHSVIVDAAAAICSWGCDSDGQLGDGLHVNRTRPFCSPPCGSCNAASNIIAMATGLAHSLAVKADGTVWSWGATINGKLGLGPGLTGDVPLPLPVPRVSDAISVAAASQTSAVLARDGTVWTSGRNNLGQLGQGTTGDTDVFAQIPGLTGVASISGGSDHFLALKADRTLVAWGQNDNGQLGDNTGINRNSPVAVSGLADVVMACAGNNHNIALKSDGTVWTWGRNNFGQLGIGGTPAFTLAPTQVTALPASGLSVAAGSNHSMVLMQIGGKYRVWTWGRNAEGQLGNGTKLDVNVPVQTAVIDDTDQPSIIAGGAFTSYAVRNGGDLWAWGSNAAGGLGVSSPAESLVPIASSGFTTPVISLAASSHVMLLRANRELISFGANANQQLGRGALGTSDSTPAATSSFARIIDVAGGWGHSLAAAEDGAVWAWGDNSAGQLGDGTMTARSTPVRVMGGALTLSSVITTVAVGGQHSLALRGSDGVVFAWGDRQFGQLGDGLISPVPSSVPVLVQFPGSPPMITAIVAGADHSLARASDGRVFAWGDNRNGQVGPGVPLGGATGTPTIVSGLPSPPTGNIVAIAAGDEHSLAIDDAGQVWGWGSNSHGQRGSGLPVGGFDAIPRIVPGVSSAVAIAGGGFHSLAVSGPSRQSYAWGRNDQGQLGNGSTMPSPTPVAVSAPANALVNTVAAGRMHSLAVLDDGTALSWGSDSDGQLGDGASVTFSTVPVTVAGVGRVSAMSPVRSFVLPGTQPPRLDIPANHSLSVHSDCHLRGWGENAAFQLGDATSTDRHVAVSVCFGGCP